MKKYVFFLLFSGIFFSCESQMDNVSLSDEAMIEAESSGVFSCVNDQADKPVTLASAQNYLVGTWQLKAIQTMLPNPQIPNYVLKISNTQGVEVYKAGKLVLTDQLKVSEGEFLGAPALIIQSEKEYMDNGDYNFLKGNIRVCEKELLVDNGMAFDAPGYFFRKMQ